MNLKFTLIILLTSLSFNTHSQSLKTTVEYIKNHLENLPNGGTDYFIEYKLERVQTNNDCYLKFHKKRTGSIQASISYTFFLSDISKTYNSGSHISHTLGVESNGRKIKEVDHKRNRQRYTYYINISSTSLKQIRKLKKAIVFAAKECKKTDPFKD